MQSTKSETFRQNCFELKPFNDLTVGSERLYLVNGLIPRVGTTVIWGKPKIGKTLVASDLVMHVAAIPPEKTEELGHLLQPVVPLVEMRS
jgi:hypothetical protein